MLICPAIESHLLLLVFLNCSILADAIKQQHDIDTSYLHPYQSTITNDGARGKVRESPKSATFHPQRINPTSFQPGSKKLPSLAWLKCDHINRWKHYILLSLPLYLLPVISFPTMEQKKKRRVHGMFTATAS